MPLIILKTSSPVEIAQQNIKKITELMGEHLGKKNPKAIRGIVEKNTAIGAATELEISALGDFSQDILEKFAAKVKEQTGIEFDISNYRGYQKTEWFRGNVTMEEALGGEKKQPYEFGEIEKISKSNGQYPTVQIFFKETLDGSSVKKLGISIVKSLVEKGFADNPPGNTRVLIKTGQESDFINVNLIASQDKAPLINNLKKNIAQQAKIDVSSCIVKCHLSNQVLLGGEPVGLGPQGSMFSKK